MKMETDEVKGTVKFVINDKVEYVIKVTWQYVHDVEAKLASMTVMLNKVSMYALTQRDLAMLIFIGTRTAKSAPSYEEICQHVFEQGIEKFIEGAAEIIKFSTGGSKNWKDFALPSTAELEIEEAEGKEEKP